MRMALRTEEMMSSAKPRSPISAAPAQPLSTLFAGQPMLMSQMSAPSSSTTSAASRMVSTSEP
jgi:hypothetical protein